MKHTTEEMLLALAVRERVAKLRDAKTRGMTKEEVQAFDAKPVNDLVEIVMQEIDGMANLISQIRSRSQS